jgi:hypothetical protein
MALAGSSGGADTWCGLALGRLPRKGKPGTHVDEQAGGRFEEVGLLVRGSVVPFHPRQSALEEQQKLDEFAAVQPEALAKGVRSLEVIVDQVRQNEQVVRRLRSAVPGMDGCAGLWLGL